MNGTITLEQAELLIAQLPPQEQLRLVAGISERLSRLELRASEIAEQDSAVSNDWMALRGIAPALLDGQDAQDWVSQNRRDADAQREQQWRRE